MSSDPNVSLEVLHVPDCSNLAPMLDRLRQVTEFPVVSREVTTDVEAATHGMAGSPTLLINGVDPFRTSDQYECGVSCRLYRDEDGRLVPVPSVSSSRRHCAHGRQRRSGRTDDRSTGDPRAAAGPCRGSGGHRR